MRAVDTLFIAQIVTEWFGKLMGPIVQEKDVFIAFTVDQGSNVVNAIEALQVPVVLCCAHRLNSVVCWMLGIADTVNTCQNPPMETLMKKLAACVGKFSHSAVNNSELRAMQELIPVFSMIYELVRRNDTRLYTFNNPV